MKKIVALLIIFFISLNINLPSWAVSNEVSQKSEEIYSLDNNYKTSFLVNNSYYLNESLTNTNSEPESGLLALNYLFPGLGSLVVGESNGTWMFILGLIPALFFGTVAVLDSKTTSIDRGWATLGAYFLAVPFYVIVYIINVVITTSKLYSSVDKTKP